MQTIECYQVTHSLFGCTAREASFPFLSLFQTVMELNHYNKYQTSWICLKPVTADFSFRFWNMNKRSDWSIQRVSLYLQYRFCLSAEFFEVRTGLALNHTGLAAPTAVSACWHIGCGHGSAGYTTAHFWCSACSALSSRYWSMDVTTAQNNGSVYVFEELQRRKYFILFITHHKSESHRGRLNIKNEHRKYSKCNGVEKVMPTLLCHESEHSCWLWTYFQVVKLEN